MTGWSFLGQFARLTRLKPLTRPKQLTRLAVFAIPALALAPAVAAAAGAGVQAQPQQGGHTAPSGHGAPTGHGAQSGHGARAGQDEPDARERARARELALLDLAIGDPARKQRTVPVDVDRIIDTRSGRAVSPSELADSLRDTRLLLLGEHHTSRESHRVQLQVIEALHRAGRPVIIGLEMYPYTQQDWLDRWSRGRIPTEEAFIRESSWYTHWGYHWGYYRDIFLFARDRGLPMAAVNAPREVVSAVRQKGFANLTQDEARHIPSDIDVDDPEHLALFKAHFAAGDATHSAGMSDAAWKDMLSAQATWDAAMGFNAVQALKRADDPRAIVVILVGSGHVAYGLGIERQVKRWFDGGVASVIPVDVADGESLPVRASYATFVWGVPMEDDTAYPSLGIASLVRTGQTERQVISVEKRSPAARAGVAVGDVLLAFDGQAITSREVLDRLTAEKGWGDVAELKVRRGTEELTLRIAFRR